LCRIVVQPTGAALIDGDPWAHEELLWGCLVRRLCDGVVAHKEEVKRCGEHSAKRREAGKMDFTSMWQRKRVRVKRPARGVAKWNTAKR
jgi:hypothetical protein